MKKLTILLVAVISAFAAISQKQPFEQYGYKVKIATLSKGKYIEHFDQDTIVQIGTVLMNRRSGKIMSFVKYDTTLGEYSLKPELVSRWMSPDPLAHEFYSESPYNFVHNNPIRYIDPDGRAPIPLDVILNVSNPTKVGDTYQTRTASMTITMTVVNMQGADLSKTMFSGSSGKLDLTGTFGGSAMQRETMKGNDVDTQYNITNVTLEYKVVNSLDQVGENDHVMMVVGDIPKGQYGGDSQVSDPAGLAERGGRASAVEAGTIASGSFNNVAQHELGHNLGLKDLKDSPKSLMNGTTSGGSGIGMREKGGIISGSGVPFSPALQHGGTFKASQNYTTPSKSVATDFLKQNGIR
jgi:hypothetical protein